MPTSILLQDIPELSLKESTGIGCEKVFAQNTPSLIDWYFGQTH